MYLRHIAMHWAKNEICSAIKVTVYTNVRIEKWWFTLIKSCRKAPGTLVTVTNQCRLDLLEHLRSSSLWLLLPHFYLTTTGTLQYSEDSCLFSSYFSFCPQKVLKLPEKNPETIVKTSVPISYTKMTKEEVLVSTYRSCATYCKRKFTWHLV